MPLFLWDICKENGISRERTHTQEQQETLQTPQTHHLNPELFDSKTDMLTKWTSIITPPAPATLSKWKKTT